VEEEAWVEEEVVWGADKVEARDKVGLIVESRLGCLDGRSI
jgi:hypothetical protein